MSNENEEPKDNEGHEEAKEAVNTGKVELGIMGRVRGLTSRIVDATTNRIGMPKKKEILPGIEKINGELGKLMGSLTYEEYRELAGILMALREEEKDHDGKSKHEAKLMKRLINFVRASQFEGVKKLAPFLEQRGYFPSYDIMTQLILMTRLYYLRGVNMLNPEADPEKEDSIKVREDKNISIHIDGIGSPILSIGKMGDEITATYPHESGSWINMTLEDGKFYIFGRGDRNYQVKDCPDSFHTLWGRYQCEMMNGIEIGKVSRSSIGVEASDGKVAFYDRASRHDLTFSWEKFSPTGQIVDRREGIAEYFSRPRSKKGSRISLGSSVREDKND